MERKVRLGGFNFLDIRNKKNEVATKKGIEERKFLLNATGGERNIGSTGEYSLGINAINDSHFRLAGNDLKMNWLIGGATQQGKSYFAVNLLSMLSKNSSLIVLDPHGEMVKDLLKILALIPGMEKRVIYWDINDQKNITGYNPFKKRDYLTRDKHLDIIKSAILTSWNDVSFDMMPRLERWLSLGIDVLYHAQLTFREAEYLFSFSDLEKRNSILSLCEQSLVTDFNKESDSLLQNQNIKRFLTDFLWLGNQSKSIAYQEIGSSYNRIFKFIYSDTCKRIFGQQDKVLDLKEIVENQKILLVNLSTQTTGGDVSRLIASLLMHEAYSLMHVRLGERGADECKKKPLFVVADEFSEIASNTITKSLSQTNKAGIYWILITQFLKQIERIDERALDDVLTNCKAKVIFGGMTKSDCKLLAETLFAVQINMKEVKQFIETYKPVQRTVTDISRAKNQTRTWNNTESLQNSYGKSTARTDSSTVTKTTGTANSSGISNSFQHSSGNTLSNNIGFTTHPDGTIIPNTGSGQGYYNSSGESSSHHASEQTSNSESDQKGIAHTSSDNSSISQGRSKSEGGSEGTGVTEHKHLHTFYEEKIIPGQFYTLEEQMKKAEDLIHMMPKGTAIIKVGHGNYAQPVIINSRKNAPWVSIESFMKYIYETNNSYSDILEAEKHLAENLLKITSKSKEIIPGEQNNTTNEPFPFN